MEGLSSPSMVQSGTHTSVLSPLLISMLGIVVTAMAIVAYHLLLVKYCKRRRAANAENAQPAAAPPPPTGVDEKVLAAIPILAFSVVKRGGIDQGECAVCLGELEDEDAVRLLPNCSHAFHVSCIDQWFAAHTSCPLCRLPVLRQKTDAASTSPDLAEDPNNRSGSGENSASNGIDEPSSVGQSIGLVRHCASLMTPMERRSSSRLKRSMSMDLSLVVIDLQRTNCPSATSFSSSSRGVLRRSGSLSHFDPKWLRSFPWLWTGKASNASNPILPF